MPYVKTKSCRRPLRINSMRNNFVVVKINKQKQKGLFADKDFKKGEVIFSLEGEILKEPTKYTIQLSREKHIDDALGQYLNHSCDPNTYISAGEKAVRALRDISKGEELSFDYNLNEYEIATPFKCRCSSPKCRGEIRGSKYTLPPPC